MVQYSAAELMRRMGDAILARFQHIGVVEFLAVPDDPTKLRVSVRLPEHCERQAEATHLEAIAAKSGAQVQRSWVNQNTTALEIAVRPCVAAARHLETKVISFGPR